MKQADLIVRGEYVLPMDEAVTVINDGAAAVLDGKIAAIGPAAEVTRQYTASQVIGGQGYALIPGLINTHTHAAMVFMRGLADDLPLKYWLEKHIWPAEARWLSPEFIRDAVSLACIEMLKSGTTAFSDMYFFQDVAGDVARSFGMRARLGAGVLDFPTPTTTGADDCLRNAEKLIDMFAGDTVIRTSIAAHSPYACSPDTLRKIRALAERKGVMVQIHLSETEWEVGEIVSRHGVRPALHLENTGLMEVPLLASHCVWLSDGEIEALARHNVGVAHCIESNLKLASGIAPVPAMLRAGVKVSFGTDGAASNNDLDLMSEMSTAAKVHKAVAKDPTVLDARTALKMATRYAAEAAGMPECGSLAPGKAADMVLIDMGAAHLLPVYDICSHLVYSARGSDVDTVIVAGRVVVSGRKVLGIDEHEVYGLAREWGKNILKGE